MAVTSSPKPTASPSPKEHPQVPSPFKGPTVAKKEKKRKVDAKEMQSCDVNNDVGSASQGGIRLVGRRIYDPLNGKTCHQCRQKTMDFAASCKNMKGNKQCTMKLCHKCLLNRYGEKAEDVALLDDWKCPKCRGICNCSFCMKKRGQKPTGQLFHKAKENGFLSVSELLETRGPESLDDFKAVKVASDQGPMLGSPRILGKETSHDVSSDVNMLLQSRTPNSKLKKLEKMKREGLKEISNGISDGAENVGESGLKKARVASKAPEAEEIKPDTCGNGKLDIAKQSDSEGSNSLVVLEAARELSKMSNGVMEKDGGVSNGLKNQDQPLIKSHRANMYPVALQIRKVEPQIPLPSGTCINAIAGIEFSPEDIGNALQFLEFCSAFGKAIHLKKGQPEAAMREMVSGQRERRLQYRSQQSLLTQIHVRLLNMIQRDVSEESESLSMKNLKNTWFQALGEFVSECEFLSKEFPSESFEGGNEAYDELKVSEKLKLLNFLCDEALNTDVLRSWIDDENSKFLERQKKAKEKVSVAREKERQLRQKMQDEVAKVLIQRNGAPLSISEHDALVMDIKAEAAEAREEILRALGEVHQKKPTSDAVRTEPALSDVDARVFWRLNCAYGLSDVLQQDLSNWSCAAPDEKWFCYAPEQKEEVEKYISGMKRRRAHHVLTNYSLGEVEAAS